jgi:hypothetical protein
MFNDNQVFIIEGLIVGNTYDVMAQELEVSEHTVFVALRTWVHECYGDIPLKDGISRLAFEGAQHGFIGRSCLPSVIDTKVLSRQEVIEQCRAFLRDGLNVDNRLKVIDIYTSMGFSNHLQLATFLGLASSRVRKRS